MAAPSDEFEPLDTVGAPGEIAILVSGIANKVLRDNAVLQHPAEELRQRSNRSVLAGFPNAFLARDFDSCIPPGSAPDYCCFPRARRLRVAPGVPQVADVTVGEVGNGFAVKQAVRELVRAFARLERPALDVATLNEELMIRGIPNSYSPTDQLSIFFWDVHIEAMASLVDLASALPAEIPGQLLPDFLSGYPLDPDDLAGLSSFQNDIFEDIIEAFSPSLPGRAVRSYIHNVDGLANYSEEDPVARFEFAAAQGAASRLEQRILELNADLVGFQADFFEFLADERLQEMQQAVNAIERKLREAERLATSQGYEALARILGGAVEDVQKLWGAIASYDWKGIGEGLGDLIGASGKVKDILDEIGSVDDLREAYREILLRQSALRDEIDLAKKEFVAKISEKEAAARRAQVSYYGYASNAKRLAEDLFRLIVVNYARDNSGQAHDRLVRRLSQLRSLVRDYPNTTFDAAGLNRFPPPCQGNPPDLCSVLSSSDFADCVRLPASSDSYSVFTKPHHQRLPGVEMLGVGENAPPSRRHFLGIALGTDLDTEPEICDVERIAASRAAPILDSIQTIDFSVGEQVRRMWSIEEGLVLAFRNRFELYVVDGGSYRMSDSLTTPFSSRATASPHRIIVPDRDEFGELAIELGVEDESLVRKNTTRLPENSRDLFFDGPRRFVVTRNSELFRQVNPLRWERVEFPEPSHRYCLSTLVVRARAMAKGEFLFGCSKAAGTGQVVSFSGEEFAPVDAAGADIFGSALIGSKDLLVVGDQRRRVASETQTEADPHYFVFDRVEGRWSEVQRFGRQSFGVPDITLRSLVAATGERAVFRVDSPLPGVVALVVGGSVGNFTPQYVLRIQQGEPRLYAIDGSRVILANQSGDRWHLEVFETQ